MHSILAMAFGNQANLKFNNQVGSDAHNRVCSKLGWANLEKGLLGLTIRCESWWNADHSYMPFLSRERRANIPQKTKEILKSATKEAATLLLDFAATLFSIRLANNNPVIMVTTE